jgi:hypothetical protein
MKTQCLACEKGRHRKHTCSLAGIRGRPPKNRPRRRGFKHKKKIIDDSQENNRSRKDKTHKMSSTVFLQGTSIPPHQSLQPNKEITMVASSPLHEIEDSFDEIKFPFFVDFDSPSSGGATEGQNAVEVLHTGEPFFEWNENGKHSTFL